MVGMKKKMNERGLSLVEVLAALALLGIVFVGFMSVFPQMTTFNKKTETKLETMNIARQEMTFIQSLQLSNPLTMKEIQSKVEPMATVSTTPVADTISIEYEKGGFQYVVLFYEKPDLGSNGYQGNKALHKVHLKVMIGGKMNSETFGYIEVEEI